MFYNLLLQVRGSGISLDANGVAVFTSVRVMDAEQRNFSGAVGLMAHSSKIAIKGWKVTGTMIMYPQNPSSVQLAHGPQGPPSRTGAEIAAEIFPEDRPIEPGGYVGSGDELHIVALIEQEIIERELGTTFDDIAALKDAKNLLDEALALPLLVPEFFVGIREPWKGVLLFGPPGTGKTMLAKAVAGMNGSTFFNCSASTLVSKSRGESEKIVRCLFGMARHYAPAIIFIDELDAIASSRKMSNEHEASRRLKTELFVQMDGVVSSTDKQVMVLATTNCPWDLDEAMRRRLEKRIYIPLPDFPSRNEMFILNLRGINVLQDVRTDALARETEGYSGADIHLVCREASMMPMRRLIENQSPQGIQAMRDQGLLQSPSVSMQDLLQAIQNTRPSVSGGDLERFGRWNSQFGSI